MEGSFAQRVRILLALAVIVGMFAGSAVAALSAESRIKAVVSPTLVDSRGKTVGSIVDVLGTELVVLLRVGTYTIALKSAGDNALSGAANTVHTPLLYESNDCSGQPYDGAGGVNPQQDPRSILKVVLLNGTKLYESIGEPRTIQFQSVLQDGTLFCDTSTVAEQAASPLREIADLAAEFVPPFRLKAAD